jgi:hypothetical protein
VDPERSEEGRARVQGCYVPPGAGLVVHHENDEQDALIEEADDLQAQQSINGALSEVDNARLNFLLATSSQSIEYEALEQKAEGGAASAEEIEKLNDYIAAEQEANALYIESLERELESSPQNADLQDKLDDAQKHHSQLHAVPLDNGDDKGDGSLVFVIAAVVLGGVLAAIGAVVMNRRKGTPPGITELLTENSEYHSSA